jgi:hypothetical protein
MEASQITAGLCYRSHLAGLTSEVTALEVHKGLPYVRHRMYDGKTPFGVHLSTLKDYAKWCRAVVPHPIHNTLGQEAATS